MPGSHWTRESVAVLASHRGQARRRCQAHRSLGAALALTVDSSSGFQPTGACPGHAAYRLPLPPRGTPAVQLCRVLGHDSKTSAAILPINRDLVLSIKRDGVSRLQPNSQCMDNQKFFSINFSYHRFSKGFNCYVTHLLKWKLLCYFVSLLVPAFYIPVDRRTAGEEMMATMYLTLSF